MCKPFKLFSQYLLFKNETTPTATKIITTRSKKIYSSIKHEIKDFIFLYVRNKEKSEQIFLNPGKFKIPKLNSITNFKEFMNEKLQSNIL